MPKENGKRIEFANIMYEFNLEYCQNIIMERGTQLLYLLLVKSIYGCIQAAFFRYKLYMEKLNKLWFVINPYDKCISNCTINGK